MFSKDPLLTKTFVPDAAVEGGRVFGRGWVTNRDGVNYLSFPLNGGPANGIVLQDRFSFDPTKRYDIQATWHLGKLHDLDFTYSAQQVRDDFFAAHWLTSTYDSAELDCNRRLVDMLNSLVVEEIGVTYSKGYLSSLFYVRFVTEELRQWLLSLPQGSAQVFPLIAMNAHELAI